MIQTPRRRATDKITPNQNCGECANLLKQDHDTWMAVLTKLEEIEMQVGDFKKAFPIDENGSPDYSGHAKAHQEQIDFYRARKEVLLRVSKKVAETSLYGILVWIGYTLTQAALAYIRGGK